jgi:2,4-dienoyl-CoA reductase-like NADH-dependent reductase (Old Yellow Enzyme family)
MSYSRVAQLRAPEDFCAYLVEIGAELPFDEDMQHGKDAPLHQPCKLNGKTIGNRFAVLPMEGWDGTLDGYPTELVTRRWQRFGQSGAKLIWGGEAVAVRHDGRANPNQLVVNNQTVGALADLRQALVDAHSKYHSSTTDLLVGLQLTHSGRFARPNDRKRLESKTLYHHPLLDGKFNLSPDHPVMTDDEIGNLIADFVRSAVLAQQPGLSLWTSSTVTVISDMSF